MKNLRSDAFSVKNPYEVAKFEKIQRRLYGYKKNLTTLRDEGLESYRSRPLN